MLYRVDHAMSGIQTQLLVVIGTDCTGSCKSNYHTITTTTAPYSHWSCVLLKKKKTHVDVTAFLNVKLLCSTDIHDDILEK
jgi:hypothetical protein